MCDNARECAAAREHGFGTPPEEMPAPVESSVRPATGLGERLGLRTGQRVALICVADPEVSSLVRDATSATTALHSKKPFDMVVYQAESVFALRRLPEFAAAIAREGCIWVLWPRGVEHIRQAHVQKAGSSAGLVDVKMTSVSERLAGVMLVHPRKAHARA